jgi:8-oxo-dGTP pyrophosphatase MutT (NUDIX family)
VRAFEPSPEEEKSRELILALLEFTEAPFSRDQFHPGHITCTAAVLHPNGQQFLLMHHHRHRRWLLPGGHVEENDVTLSDTAKREAIEETAVRIADSSAGTLVGMDVHGIPAPSTSRSICITISSLLSPPNPRSLRLPMKRLTWPGAGSTSSRAMSCPPASRAR